MSKRQASNSKASRDNRANQLNPQHPIYHRGRGSSRSEADYNARHDQAALNNRANQLNPNNPLYKGSSGSSGQ